MRNLSHSEYAESEESWSEGEVDEFNDIVDDLVKPLTELITYYYCAGQDEASYRGDYCIPCKYKSHSDLWLVAFIVDFRLHCQMYHVLFFKDLVHDISVGGDDKDAC